MMPPSLTSERAPILFLLPKRGEDRSFFPLPFWGEGEGEGK